jgi:hypothetical protein
VQRDAPRHARLLALHRAMLYLRRTDPVLSAPDGSIDARAEAGILYVVRRSTAGTRTLAANLTDVPRPHTAGAAPLRVTSWDHDGAACPGPLPPYGVIIVDA